MKNDNYRELTPEELEAINGGGLKEIVAATTLAAMAMTGNTVSAFGLASALAEENAHIEQAPAQEAVGEAFEGEMEEEITAASVDEIVEEADMSLTEEGATEIIPENENTSGTADEEEAVEEVEEADLGELTGEAEAEAEAEAVIEDEDKQQLMADLIGMAVEEHRTEGIYAALNSTFATLADNAEALANPETGVIETDGDAIVGMTYDALSASFDNSPEQLMGAIGAAAYRADVTGGKDVGKDTKIQLSFILKNRNVYTISDK